MENKLTGFVDENGVPIRVGDKLICIWGYSVIVYELEDGHYAGKLICDPGHSCENIPYSLNNGAGHFVDR